MLILAVLLTWIRATTRTLVTEYTPRTGRHRGVGRASRAAYKRRAADKGFDGAHTGSLYGVSYVLQQSTRGLSWTASTPLPTAAYPIVVTV